jgi:inner membrane protein
LDSEGTVLSDLRMGVEPDYVFAFRVADNGNPHPKAIVPQRIATKRDYGRLKELLERM